MHEITLRHLEATKYGISADVAPQMWFGYGTLTEEISHSDAVQSVQEQFGECGCMIGWATRKNASGSLSANI